MKAGAADHVVSTAVDYDPFAGSSLARAVRTTESQREIWLACKVESEASLAYNESVTFEFHGPLDAVALRQAVADVIARHEALRATISGDGHHMLIADAVTPDFKECNLGAPSPALEPAAALRALQDSEVALPFDLERGPLLRVRLARLGDEWNALVVTAHHIVFDGWSSGIFASELGLCYDRRRSGDRASDEPAPQYGDFAQAERTAEADGSRRKAEQFWTQCFSGSVPVLDLPADRPRPAARTFASRREDLIIPSGLVEMVRTCGKRHGSSFLTTLLTAFAVLLQRFCRADEVVVGVPAAAQAQEGWGNLIGHCVNLLPVRLAIDTGADFATALARVQSTLIDAIEHQQLTMGSLLRKLPIDRDASRPPLVSVMFNVDQAIDTGKIGFGGLRVRLATNARCAENFEISVNAVQRDGELVLECQYNIALFDQTSIRRWLTAYRDLLRRACEAPSAPLRSLALIGDQDRARLASWNATVRAMAPARWVDALFLRAAHQHGARPALRSRGTTHTYAQLAERAAQLAAALRSRGLRRGQRVGILLERDADMVASLLAVLQCGAAYVPLDPTYPFERLSFMARDSDITLLMANRAFESLLPWPPEGRLDPREVGASTGGALAPAAEERDAEDEAYVIYTSGTTGLPKGVRLPHRAVVNFIESMTVEPGIASHDRVAAVTTLSFDIAVNEILAPLCAGATVILASREEAGDGVRLRALLEAEGVTQLQATPSTWQMLIDAGWRGNDGLRALSGGEGLPRELARELLGRCGQLWNMYGPTETTVWSTCARIIDSERISVGRPIANTRVHVVDEALNPCPIGVPGEICIAGAGVALGYHQRAQLDAEKFLADPFDPPGRLYRTGDSGRWRDDGTLEHLGRLDSQVKVRGFRIELGEVENQLGALDGVQRATVVTRSFAAGDVRIVAYLVGTQQDDGSVRAQLRRRLPDYMVPQHFVWLHALPLLPNGKVDRKALPAPAVALTHPVFTAPRNELERLVAQQFEAALALPEVGVDDHFFRLGGHSLLASQLAARLGRQLSIQIPMRVIFEAPTVAALAHWIQSNGSSAARPEIRRRVDQSLAPLSAMQQRMWFLEELDPGKAVNNSPSAHRLVGELDQQAFARAFAEMVRRQHSLRTVFELNDGEPVQRILDAVPCDLLPASDLRDLPAPQREAAMMAEIVEAIRTPFDLQQPPLFRARLYRLDAHVHVFFFMPHHMIWDGWSFDLLYAEMAALYDAFLRAAPSPLPELELSYGDFAAWQAEWMRSDEMQSQVRHWTARLRGALEPLALPTDYPRPPSLSGNAQMNWLQVPRSTVEAVRQFATREGATVFMTLFAVYVLMLHGATGQRTLVIGTPVRGRHTVELEPIMGFFVNALPIRVEVPENADFRAVLGAVRDSVLDAFKHPDVPFERLVHELDVPRDRSRTPIAQTMFSYQDARRRISRWGNVDRERVEVLQPGLAGDLNLWCVELRDSLLFGFSFAPELFSQSTALMLRDRYLHLLATVLRRPELEVSGIPLADAELRNLKEWNARTVPFDRSARMHAAFARHAAHAPERIAISCQGESVTYGVLAQEAARTASALRGLGIGAGDRVGIYLQRTPQLIVALLAILECGAAYVPLDPAYPDERLAAIREDARLSCVVVASRTGLTASIGGQLLALDELSAPADAPLRAVAGDPEDTAYVLFTSGSTGRPKGVAVPHRAVVNFLASMAREPGLGPEDRLVAVTTLSFDIAVLELMLPLSVGARVILATQDEAQDGDALGALLGRHHANVMQATPATWQMLLETGWRPASPLRALVGGEALPPRLAQDLLEAGCEVWNMYGPTETTVWSTCWRVADPTRGIRIGRPIANTEVWVLDEARRPCAIGVCGELWIAGEGVANGYLGRPDLTAERFLDNPFGPGKMYRTGDRGRWCADGTLEHLGRLDFQVKIRGFRIEPGEIEACLAEHPAIHEVVVLAREDQPGDVRLVAYHVVRPGQHVDAAQLRETARRRLPPYMLPQHFVQLGAMPRLPNGKIDRKGFPLPEVATAQNRAFALPETPTEIALAKVWSELLGVDDISADDNFFDLGGHSLLSLRAISIMQNTLGTRVNPGRYLFDSLRQIARVYDEGGDQPAAKAARQPGGWRRLFGKLWGEQPR
jgi:amino acid adenylation domain-containing protein